jgi:UDP-N-acetylmuramate: L-alanyl-gamma-D-glutamyl-meso-diaminopimelate ligase
MHIHILGICGTFMAGIAQLAKQEGYIVTGCDTNIYPPMSEFLPTLGIDIIPNFDEKQLSLNPDCYIIGNAITRGNPLLESILNNKLPYQSGPQWLYEQMLHKYQVIAISGTHGKTTTASMVSHILQEAGHDPGFLIGGVCQKLKCSAKLGEGEYFVIEADEYDTAFFDKRPKFLHYNPHISVINNLEYDHADIYQSLNEIEKQFHFLIRRMPSNGIIIRPNINVSIDRVIAMGCWTPIETTGYNDNSIWRFEPKNKAVSAYDVYYQSQLEGSVDWRCFGNMNAENGLNAIAACFHAGVDISDACHALKNFRPVKRRLELTVQQNGLRIYDDFAHHPTAIASTLSAIRNKVGKTRVIAVIDFGSYSMKHGIFKNQLNDALEKADLIFALKPESFELENSRVIQMDNVDAIVGKLIKLLKKDDTIVVMSNRGFDNIAQKLHHCITP